MSFRVFSRNSLFPVVLGIGSVAPVTHSIKPSLGLTGSHRLGPKDTIYTICILFNIQHA